MRPVNLGNAPQPAANDSFGAWVLAALKQVEAASNDILQNDASSSGAAMATVHGAAADEIVYYTDETHTDFTALSPFARTVIAATTAAAMAALINAAGTYFAVANNLSEGVLKTKRSNLGIDGMTVIGDVNYTVLATDRLVLPNTNLSVNRTLTLPAANSVNAGYEIAFNNTTSNGLGFFWIIDGNGAETINGLPTFTFSGTWQQLILRSDGSGAWIAGIPAVNQGGTGAITASAARSNLGAAGVTQTDFISGIIKSAANQDYRIVEKIPYGATLTAFTGKTASGTLTATLKINTTAVTTGAINVTSTQGSVSPSAANVLVAGDALVITVSAISSPVDFSFTVAFTRTLA